MQIGKCFTWEDHWAASWKNLTSLHSTPSMRTRSMFCWCLAVQISRLMPSMHWLLDSTSLSFVFLGKNITFLFFSLVTTVMDMVGVAAVSPLPGSLLTWRDRKVHLSVFLVVGMSFFSASLFLSAGCAAVQ